MGIRSKRHIKFYSEEYIPRSNPKHKELPKGSDRFIKPKIEPMTQTIIEITGKKSSWTKKKVAMLEDKKKAYQRKMNLIT